MNRHCRRFWDHTFLFTTIYLSVNFERCVFADYDAFMVCTWLCSATFSSCSSCRLWKRCFRNNGGQIDCSLIYLCGHLKTVTILEIQARAVTTRACLLLRIYEKKVPQNKFSSSSSPSSSSLPKNFHCHVGFKNTHVQHVWSRFLCRSACVWNIEFIVGMRMKTYVNKFLNEVLRN